MALINHARSVCLDVLADGDATLKPQAKMLMAALEPTKCGSLISDVQGIYAALTSSKSLLQRRLQLSALPSSVMRSALGVSPSGLGFPWLFQGRPLKTFGVYRLIKSTSSCLTYDRYLFGRNTALDMSDFLEVLSGRGAFAELAVD
jgi:hypothetical protein